MARPPDDDLPRAVEELVAPIAGELGLEVLDLKVKGQRGSRMVRLTVDVADLDAEAGVDIDEVALLSRRLEDALDTHDPIAGGYTLEVTSPGADRPLTRARDFARNRGRAVRIELADGAGEVTGELTAVSETTLTLTTDNGDRDLALSDIERGHVVLPW